MVRKRIKQAFNAEGSFFKQNTINSLIMNRVSLNFQATDYQIFISKILFLFRPIMILKKTILDFKTVHLKSILLNAINIENCK